MSSKGDKSMLIQYPAVSRISKLINVMKRDGDAWSSDDWMLVVVYV
jgi:hypothetical protein